MTKSNFDNVRVLGSRHCFNTIADTKTTGRTAHVSLDKMVWYKFNGLEVTFGAGSTYSKLMEAVVKQGLAITNLPSLPHLNVVGSMITGTHGSGHKFGIQAHMITGFEMVLADGSLLTLKNTDKDFKKYILTFGAIGVVTSMTIKLEPKFEVLK